MIVSAFVKNMTPVRTWKNSVGEVGRAQDLVISWGEQYVKEDGTDGVYEHSQQVTAFGDVIDNISRIGVAPGQYVEVNILLKAKPRGQYVDNVATIHSIKLYQAPQFQQAQQQQYMPQPYVAH